MSENIVSKVREVEKLSRQRLLAEMEADAASRNRVVLFYQESPYGLQEYIIQRMKQLLLQKGYRVTDISMSIANPYSNCDKKLGQWVKDICLVFSMDAIAFEMKIYNGQRWINTMSCPCISYLYHSASCFSAYLDMDELSWNVEFHAADKDDLTFIREWYQESADTRSVSGFAFACEKMQQWQDRTYDVYLPGDYIPSEICRHELNQLPAVFQTIAGSMIAKMEQNSSFAAHAALKQVLDEINFACDNQEFFALLEELKMAANYVKMKEREQVLEVLLRRGLVVAVYGNGWEQYSGENMDHLRLISMEEAGPDFETHLNIIARSKCFVDFPCSDHENTMIHVLSAMKNGAVVLSSRQDLRKDYFTDGEEILFYGIGTSSLESLLENYFDTEVMQSISEKALSKSEEFMNIEDYLELLLQIEEGK